MHVENKLAQSQTNLNNIHDICGHNSIEHFDLNYNNKNLEQIQYPPEVKKYI